MLLLLGILAMTPQVDAASQPTTLTAREVALPLLEESYIALAPKMPEPLLFEANIAPHFVVAFADRSWGVVLTPKVLVRMDRRPSSPIRTPSFMPSMTAFVDLGRMGDGIPPALLSLSVGHHSNGEEGPALIDGRNNHVDGSFSTNYVEPGLTFTWRSDGMAYAGFYLQHHPAGFNQNSELPAQYGLTRYINRFRLVVSQFVLGFDVMKIVGDRTKHPDAPLTLPQSARVSVLYRPSWLQELAITVSAYSGPDYYNIWYDENLLTYRIGIAAFSFPGA